MQMALYFDQSRCIGCHTCSVACKDWHDIEAGPINWRRIISTEKGTFPNLSLAYLSISCNHCAEPSCMLVCSTDAITKGEKGIVLIDRERCLGKDDCGLCKKACPYDVPQFGDEKNAKMQMCNFCYDRLMKNKKPICVEACIMRALDAGPLKELIDKYGDVRETEGFRYSKKTKPSIIFKPKI